VDSILKRLSFGFNEKGALGTSMTVAYGLVLNYLARTVSSHILPDILKAENLRGSDWDAQRYPQTVLLHRYLISQCRLSSRLLGLWGKKAVRRIRRFWRKDPWQLGVAVRSAFGGYGAKKAWRVIKKEVRANRPLMVTTNYQRLRCKGELFSTMVACGYRVTKSGQREVLVHPGRYDDYIKGSRVQLVYVPLQHVLCSYHFDVVLLPLAL
jgi:hypothetical protein